MEIVWIFSALTFALIFVVIFLRFVPVGLWITALASGVHVSIGSLIGMRLRRIAPKRLVEPLIKARKAGLEMTLSKLEPTILPAAMWIASSTRLSPHSAPTSKCLLKRRLPSIWLAATCCRLCR